MYVCMCVCMYVMWLLSVRLRIGQVVDQQLANGVGLERVRSLANAVGVRIAKQRTAVEDLKALAIFELAPLLQRLHEERRTGMVQLPACYCACRVGGPQPGTL